MKTLNPILKFVVKWNYRYDKFYTQKKCDIIFFIYILLLTLTIPLDILLDTRYNLIMAIVMLSTVVFRIIPTYLGIMSNIRKIKRYNIKK